MTAEKTKEFQESRDGCAERERTAATLLAALYADGRRSDAYADSDGTVTVGAGDVARVAFAVALADTLRAALRGAP